PGRTTPAGRTPRAVGAPPAGCSRPAAGRPAPPRPPAGRCYVSGAWAPASFLGQIPTRGTAILDSGAGARAGAKPIDTLSIAQNGRLCMDLGWIFPACEKEL